MLKSITGPKPLTGRLVDNNSSLTRDGRFARDSGQTIQSGTMALSSGFPSSRSEKLMSVRNSQAAEGLRMPMPCRRIAIFIISLSALSCFAQSDSRRAADVDRYLQPYFRSRNFSGAVLVSKDRELAFKSAYGFANREKRFRNTTETRFHIASVSMQFTAAAILRLID